MPIRAHFFRQASLTRKGQTDLVFGVRWDGDSLVGLCMQDYKSLCVQRLRFVPPWLTSRQTDTHTYTHTNTHTDSILTSLYEKLSQLS